jgi:hypothetical protein
MGIFYFLVANGYCHSKGGGEQVGLPRVKNCACPVWLTNVTTQLLCYSNRRMTPCLARRQRHPERK